MEDEPVYRSIVNMPMPASGKPGAMAGPNGLLEPMAILVNMMYACQTKKGR